MTVGTNLTQAIKKAAMDAVRASKPCDFLIGTITSVSPLKIKISQKVTLEGDFFDVTETFDKKTHKTGDKVVLIQGMGAQRYLVIDKVVI